MRKTILEQDGSRVIEQADWLDLPALASVEITSEDDLFPIEHAVGRAVTNGWRAGATGRQIIRLRFDDPVEVHRVYLHVMDRSAERRQEMAIYATLEGLGRQEVWRGQYVFSPHGATEQVEDLTVTLPRMLLFELQIDPDGADNGHASQHYAVLAALKLA